MKNYTKKDESVYEKKNPGMGHLFPWVAVIFSKEGRFTMSFRTEKEAKEAAGLWSKS